MLQNHSMDVPIIPMLTPCDYDIFAFLYLCFGYPTSKDDRDQHYYAKDDQYIGKKMTFPWWTTHISQCIKGKRGYNGTKFTRS